ncbi:hypothetical protein [Amycolatopsis sp. FDAARGOS 1241]|nr:hypothetical protein [Amycolatopsis sp. FDAARGOS 1241]QRP42780.1 hypothetical protein I6J71_25220 [Amycolatopsis sp. FDAARGOS 1241]
MIDRAGLETRYADQHARLRRLLGLRGEHARAAADFCRLELGERFT